MHLISLHPARRIFYVILAVFLPLLVGCRGGNGTFVSAPPPAGVNLTDLTNATQLQVDQLFAKIIFDMFLNNSLLSQHGNSVTASLAATFDDRCYLVSVGRNPSLSSAPLRYHWEHYNANLCTSLLIWHRLPIGCM